MRPTAIMLPCLGTARVWASACWSEWEYSPRIWARDLSFMFVFSGSISVSAYKTRLWERHSQTSQSQWGVIWSWTALLFERAGSSLTATEGPGSFTGRCSLQGGRNRCWGCGRRDGLESSSCAGLRIYGFAKRCSAGKIPSIDGNQFYL